MNKFEKENYIKNWDNFNIDLYVKYLMVKESRMINSEKEWDWMEKEINKINFKPSKKNHCKIKILKWLIFFFILFVFVITIISEIK